jgi:hypothetical protein
MKRQVIIAGAVVLCSIAFGAVEGVAQQIFNQFRQPELVVGRPYRDINDCDVARLNKNILPATSFVLPPTNVVNRDDGYARIQFPAGFRFNFGGQVFDHIFVSVNGFATFDGTKLVPAKESAGLFTNSSSYPDNVIAPFWGNHYYRSAADVGAGYMPTEISWVVDVDRNESCDTIKPVRKVLVIQWKNLNINDPSVNSSVGNFQARLYLGADSTNWQGDVELAYGQVGGNPNTTNTVVVTRGATVGVKGNGGFPGFISDFWNGLLWQPAAGANRRTDSTTRWQPSDGRSDAVIRFGAILYFTFDNWGYGDADTSAAEKQRHAGMSQNRRVTSNDARVIIRSMVTGIPLDSVWKRQAYQGDVNHSGRFYYTRLTRDFTMDSLDPNTGQIVIWRRTIDVDQYTSKQVLRVLFEGEGLYGVGGRAPDVSSLNQIYYEVTEYDAALIMRYLSGRLPYLPWIYDNDTTGPDFGKVSDTEFADNVTFGTPVSVGNGLVRVPVYLNGAHNGAFGVRFSANSVIEGVSPVSSENGTVASDYSSHTAVLIGNGSFTASSPIAFVVVKEQNLIELSNIRFNEKNLGSVKLQGLEDDARGVVTFPNPMVSATSIAVNVPTSSTVTVKIFDVFGSEINTVYADQATAGTLTTTWNGTNYNGTPVAPGAYIVRVVGEGFSMTNKITVAR